MSEFIAILKHSGGCDYTLACGTLVIEKPNDQTIDSFINDIMKDYSDSEYNPSIAFMKVQKVEVERVRTVTEYKMKTY